MAKFVNPFAKREGVDLRTVGFFSLRLTAEIKDATYDEALAQICKRAQLAFRVAGDGTYVVGYPKDLKVEFASPSYDSPTPQFQGSSSSFGYGGFSGSSFQGGSPAGGSFQSYGGGTAMNSSATPAQGFGASDQNLRRDDVIVKGPAEEGRRVLVLAGN